MVLETLDFIPQVMRNLRESDMIPSVSPNFLKGQDMSTGLDRQPMWMGLEGSAVLSIHKCYT